MTSILKGPPTAGGPAEQADWLELKALFSYDGNASIQDLAAELRREGPGDGISEGERDDNRWGVSERLVIDAFSEIEDRAVSAGSGYPFSVGDQYIQIDSAKDIKMSSYVFQLLLSQFGVEAGNVAGVRPERDFEDLSLWAARRYFGTSPHVGSYRFAFPRRGDERSFPHAVDKLSVLLGEGGGAKTRTLANQQQDAGLDIVVWNGFPDKRPGQVIAFGQCTTAKNWKGKANDLVDAQSWCISWMRDAPSVSPIRMFFCSTSASAQLLECDASPRTDFL